MNNALMPEAARAARGGRHRLRILTWHVHGNYLYSLSHVPHDFIIPVMADNRAGYGALGPNIPWGSNVHQVPAEHIKQEQLDCVIYQSRTAFECDRFSLLSARQLALPCAYIEHNPPEPHPTDTRHFFQHDRGVLIHVTAYNALMWDASNTPARVIEHGIAPMSQTQYRGGIERGISVINNLRRRGRRVGADIYEWAAARAPLDLIGMRSEEMGGLGEIPNRQVAGFMARYRFFFTPTRYASLSLALIEAMMAGMPIVGIAATELPTVITNGVNGYVDTDRRRILQCMRQLLDDRELAAMWGDEARRTARLRYGIDRFVSDWLDTLSSLVGVKNEQHAN